MRRVCVFCGSSSGRDPTHAAAARAFADALVERGLGLVYGGGGVGLMGVLADRVLERGGEAIGVIPRRLLDLEVAHEGLHKLHVVEGMHERKLLMTELSDAFVALPGGHGTLDELFEALTWRQLGIHGKPVGLLDAAGYFEPLRRQLERFVAEGFVRPETHALLLVEREPERLLTRLMEEADLPGDPA